LLLPAAILILAVAVVAVVMVVAAELFIPFRGGDFLSICQCLIFDHNLKGSVKFVI
jgi:hypothetical protein